MSHHGYNGYKRAKAALAEKETRLIDTPIVGQLGEGVHKVEITEVHGARAWVDVVFSNSHGSFTQRISKQDDDHIDALAAAAHTRVSCEHDCPRLIGCVVLIRLEYNQDGYRVAVNSLGYLAVLPHENWKRVAGPVAELRDLRHDTNLPQATLAVTEYDFGENHVG
jgi:hypothetical protein